MTLVTAILITTFAPQSRHPRRTVYIRLGGLFAAACGIGLLLAVTLPDLPPLALSPAYTLAAGICTVQLAVTVAHLTAASVLRLPGTVLNRWLLTLPLGSLQRWILFLLPSLVLTCITLGLLGPPVASLCMQMGLHAIWLPTVFGVGAITALGLYNGLSGLGHGTHWLAGGLIVYGEYTLLNALATRDSAGAYYGLCCILCTLVILFLFSRYLLRREIAISHLGKQYWCVAWPHTWFYKKIFRLAHTRLSFMTAVVITTILAYAGHRYAVLADQLVVIASLVLAAFVSDVRATARRKAPVEIAGLRGSIWFTVYHLLAVMGCAGIAVLPLAVIGVLDLPALAQVTLGVAVGLLAGTAIVPEARDVSGQCIASLLCLLLLVIVPQAVAMTGYLATQLLLAAMMVTTAGIIEYLRNPYKWRTHA